MVLRAGVTNLVSVLNLSSCILYSLSCLLYLSPLLHVAMNRLKQLFAVILTEDPEDTHTALEAAGVPVSFDDCRSCPNPCEDGMEALSIPTSSINLG